jgi:hypothetical protein
MSTTPLLFWSSSVMDPVRGAPPRELISEYENDDTAPPDVVFTVMDWVRWPFSRDAVRKRPPLGFESVIWLLVLVGSQADQREFTVTVSPLRDMATLSSPPPGWPSPLASTRMGKLGPTIRIGPWARTSPTRGGAVNTAYTTGAASVIVHTNCLMRSVMALLLREFRR